METCSKQTNPRQLDSHNTPPSFGKTALRQKNCHFPEIFRKKNRISALSPWPQRTYPNDQNEYTFPWPNPTPPKTNSWTMCVSTFGREPTSRDTPHELDEQNPLTNEHKTQIAVCVHSRSEPNTNFRHRNAHTRTMKTNTSRDQERTHDSSETNTKTQSPPGLQRSVPFQCWRSLAILTLSVTQRGSKSKHRQQQLQQQSAMVRRLTETSPSSGTKGWCLIWTWDVSPHLFPGRRSCYFTCGWKGGGGIISDVCDNRQNWDTLIGACHEQTRHLQVQMIHPGVPCQILIRHSRVPSQVQMRHNWSGISVKVRHSRGPSQGWKDTRGAISRGMPSDNATLV